MKRAILILGLALVAGPARAGGGFQGLRAAVVISPSGSLENQSLQLGNPFDGGVSAVESAASAASAAQGPQLRRSALKSSSGLAARSGAVPGPDGKGRKLAKEIRVAGIVGAVGSLGWLGYGLATAAAVSTVVLGLLFVGFMAAYLAQRALDGKSPLG